MYKVEHEDLAQRVHKTLKGMILNGELKSGRRLAQDELAEQLGVSRTPLLSAFSKLEREMLVTTIPRRGAFVRTYSHQELLDIYDIRLRLEPLGARNATERATDEEIEELQRVTGIYEETVSHADPGAVKEEDYRFHLLLMKMSRNEFLHNIISSNNIILIANIQGLLKDPADSLAQHRTIVDAVRSRDPDAAEECMYHHLFTSRTNLKERGDGTGNP
jgi:DNA-binding GntR family transcriptional regulator